MATEISQPRPFTSEPQPGLTLSGSEEGRGPPLVCLHGLTATRRYVLQGSRALARSGRLVVAYDARGHGDSSPAPDGLYGYPELVADLEAVLDERGIDSCVLAGSSMGAATAMAFALDYPDRVDALVQITPAYDGQARTGSSSLEGWDARADAMAAGDLDRFVRLTGVDELPERMRESARTAVRQRTERHLHPEAVAEALRQVPRSSAFDGLDRLGSVDRPVLIVGSRDEADPEHPLEVAREYERLLPDADLVVEDEGQPPLAWQGARLSRAISAFLDERS